MISRAEIDSIRADAQQLLQDRCRVASRNLLSDGGGGFIASWEDEAQVPCRIAPLSIPSTVIEGEKIVEGSTHVITLPHHVRIRPDSKIVYGGQIWNVVGVTDRQFDRFVVRAQVRLADG